MILNSEVPRPETGGEDSQPWIPGRIARWKKTYGFILYQANNEERSVFFHHTSVNYVKYKKITLRPTMEVRFKLEEDEQGRLAAIDVCARNGGPLDYHVKTSEDDIYDREIKYGGQWFDGSVKFFDRNRGYGRVKTIPEQLEALNITEVKSFLYFKEVDVVAEGYPIQIRSGNPVRYQIYHSVKYGWGAMTLQYGDGQRFQQLKKKRRSKKVQPQTQIEFADNLEVLQEDAEQAQN